MVDPYCRNLRLVVLDVRLECATPLTAYNSLHFEIRTEVNPTNLAHKETAQIGDKSTNKYILYAKAN